MKIMIAGLLVVTCMVAFVHINQQEEISCMVIRTPDRDIPVDFTDLDQVDFAGELVDGKGVVTSHTYRGVLLKDLLAAKAVEVSALTVTSADQYNVEFTREEILQEDKVYAVIAADGISIDGIDPGTSGVQIIVFGDLNSRRCVRYAAIIEMLP